MYFPARRPAAEMWHSYVSTRRCLAYWGSALLERVSWTERSQDSSGFRSTWALPSCRRPVDRTKAEISPSAESRAVSESLIWSRSPYEARMDLTLDPCPTYPSMETVETVGRKLTTFCRRQSSDAANREPGLSTPLPRLF